MVDSIHTANDNTLPTTSNTFTNPAFTAARADEIVSIDPNTAENMKPIVERIRENDIEHNMENDAEGNTEN